MQPPAQLPEYLRHTVIDFQRATSLRGEDGTALLLVEIVRPNLFFIGNNPSLAGPDALQCMAWMLNCHADADLYKFECIGDKLMVYILGVSRLSWSAPERHAKELRRLLQAVLGENKVRVQYTTSNSRVRAWDPEDPPYYYSYVSANLLKSWYRATRSGGRVAI